MYETEKRSILVVLMLILSLIFIPTIGAETNSVQGVTDKTIKIGYFSVCSGPVSLAGTSGWDGFSIAVNEINAQGGINGRKIDLVGPYDTACKPAQANSAVNRLISLDKVFTIAGGGCSGDTLATIPTVKESGIPLMLGISSSAEFFREYIPNLFRAGMVGDGIQGPALAGIAAKKLNATKVALLYVANDYGKNAANLAYETLKDKYNITPLAKESYDISETDFRTHIVRLKNVNPEVIILIAYHKEAGVILRQSKEMGLSDVQWLGGSAVSTPLLYPAAGEAVDGLITEHHVPVLTEGNDPEMVAYKEKLNKIYKNGLAAGRPSDYDLYCYGAAKVMIEGLKRAGRNLTWDSYIKALETIKDFKTGVIFPVTFTPKDHDGCKEIALVRWSKDGTRTIIDHLNLR